MFNKIILVGHLTRDIELRYTNGGSCIGSSGIAVTRKYTNAQGQKAEDTCFIDIVFFGKQAEIANQYLTKGSKLLIEGRLKFEQWQDNNGQNRSKHSVQVEVMEMLGSPQQGQQPNNQQQNYGSYQQGYNQLQQNPQQTQGSYNHRPAPQQSQPQSHDDSCYYADDDDGIPF